MRRATSYALNDHMELAGPTLEEQCAEAVARMERHGVVIERVEIAIPPKVTHTSRMVFENPNL